MWTEKNVESTGKSPHFSRSTVHGPRPHFIDTLKIVKAAMTKLKNMLICYVTSLISSDIQDLLSYVGQYSFVAQQWWE